MCRCSSHEHHREVDNAALPTENHSVSHQSYRSVSPPAPPYVDMLGMTPLIYPKDQCPRLRLMLAKGVPHAELGEDAIAGK